MKVNLRTLLTRQYFGLFGAATFVAFTELCCGVVMPVIAGQCLGLDAFAALAAVYAYRMMPDIFAILIADGSSVLFAHAIGRCDREEAARIFSRGLLVAVVVGLALTVCFVLFEDDYLDLMGVTGSVRAEALRFGEGYRWSLLPGVVSIYLFFMTYIDGGKRTCTCASVGFVVINIVLSWLFAGRWGTKGLAFVSTICCLSYVMGFVLHRMTPTNGIRFSWRLEFRTFGKVLALGFGSAVQPIASAVLSFVFARFASANFGAMGLAALSAVVAVESLLFFPKAAGQSAVPLVSVYCGERNPIGVRRTMMVAFVCVVAEGVLFSVAISAFPQFIGWMFGLSAMSGQSAQTLNSAVRVVGFFLLPASLTFFWGMYFRMTGRTKLVLVYSVFQWLVFPLVTVFACVDVFGITGLGCAFFGHTAWLVLIGLGIYVYSTIHGLAFPFLFTREMEAHWRMVSVGACAAGALKAAAALRKVLRNKLDPSDRRQVLVPLAAEELVNVIAEENQGKTVRVEMSLDVTDVNSIRLIVRDDGMIFDPTDPDRKVGSLAAYTLARLVSTWRERINLTTTGHNRSILVFPDRGKLGER